VASAIVIGVLRGLHVAHEAKGSNGVPLELVHRDVSPQNVLVGADGTPRMLDFGIAKAAGREQSTIARGNGSSRDIRGKLAYMAPEQVSGEPIDRRADLFAAGVMLWETLASERLFRGEDAFTTMEAIFHREPPFLSKTIAGVSTRVDEVLAMALAKDPAQRFATADEMARAIEIALPPGSDREVADWVEAIAAEILTARAAIIARFEGSTDSGSEPCANDENDSQDPTTRKRSALIPPAMGEQTAVLPGPVAADPKLRDSARTLPGFDPSLLGSAPQVPAATVPIPNPENEPLRTPLSMVTPALDPMAASGMTSTRIGPIDFDAKKRSNPAVPRTPIPMPMPEQKAKLSVARIAALVAIPPMVAALSIFFIRPAAPAPEASASAGQPVAAVTAEIPPPIPAPPAAPPVAAKPADPPPHAAPTVSAPSSAKAPPRARPLPRVPRRR
jgi:serine/threonine-protein kinase